MIQSRKGGRSSSESRSVSRPSTRSGSRDNWEHSFWTDREDNNDNENVNQGEINFIENKNVLIAKVKNTVTLQPRMGAWIPINCNLNVKNSNDFLYSVVFNSIIECNSMITKFSPQARALPSPVINIYNANDFLVQVR